MTMWKPGMRCVCVDARNASQLRKGSVYTVLEVVPDTGVSTLGVQSDIALLLVEANAPADFIGFCPSRFRPLSETRLDQFRQHLAPKPKVEERV